MHIKHAIFIALLVATLGACSHATAQCSSGCTTTSDFPCQSGCQFTMATAGCCAAPAPVKVPDVADAPASLPPYGSRVLLWDGEQWQVATRDSTDKDGEHWSVLSGDNGCATSKKRPMWKPLPPAPKDTPMCSGVVDGVLKKWLPHAGLCQITDAQK